jgi:hypothetical protein
MCCVTDEYISLYNGISSKIYEYFHAAKTDRLNENQNGSSNFHKILQYQIYIQSQHKITLHFQNDTENKCGVLKTSYLHQSIEKISKFCTHLTETRYVFRESHGRFRDDSPTRSKLCAECPKWWMQMHPFLLEFLVPGVNGFSAWWFHVKLCAKCTLHSCYRLFLR